MSRAPSLSSGRNLTLPEELERLEQSITLTLQEIDHNFSKAHRIVTGSILPLVEQYGENSRSVWEASKFWKQFFEASANVSLSGYEELAEDNDESTAAEETTLEDEATSEYSAAVQDDNDEDVTAEQPGYHHEQQQRQRQRRDVEESLLDDVEMSGSTPRPPAGKSLKAQKLFADFDSPYEKLRREMQSGGGGGGHGKGGSGNNEDNITVKSENDGHGEEQQQPLGSGGENVDVDDDETTEMELPAHATGKATTRLPDMSMTGRSSSLLLDEPTLTLQDGRQLQQTFEQSRSGGGNNSTKTKDPLLHRVLHKNYRLQATPHKGAPLLPPPTAWGGLGVTPDKGKDKGNDKDKDEDRTRRALWADSPTSSPEMAVPKLRSDLYMSPAKAKGARRGAAAKATAGRGHHHYNEPPRTPGVSVQTPGTARKTRDVFAEERERERERETAEKAAKGKGRDEITWDSDSDDDTEGGGGGLFGGMSPPKTIQFALPPSKLMRTPGMMNVAREASKRIVEDILLTAGAAPEESSEYSPTMVKMNQDILDDTF